ncbi:hypothetical protein [Streptomyces alboflavus]|uniref:hypothetical protein n=1 Tax=Streptomyces alboflavus TaxID=67267 RepID=UPI001331593E|nr:hypothetical protein [Streptomyces alboflavus]
MNFIKKRLARRLVGRTALAALLANELEYGDLKDRIFQCLDDRGADDVLREAVARELAKFRRTATRNMKLAQLTELASAEEDGTADHFFAGIEAADVRAERLLPESSSATENRTR